MAERDELVRVVAGAVGAHNLDEWTVHARLRLPFRCYCGFEAADDDLDGSPEWFRTHQATAVVDALGEHLARAWDDGREVGVSVGADCCGSCPVPGPCGKQVAEAMTNPYRTAERTEP